MSRREFAARSSVMIAAASLSPMAAFGKRSGDQASIRLGSQIHTEYNSPEEWISLLKDQGYRAALCPVNASASREEIRAYKDAAARADIIIAEVGTYSNPISPDARVSEEAFERCIKGLQLAEEIGAECSVTVSGSRNKDYFAGPHRDNLTDETFDMVVEATRRIIDAVKPKRTWFALEPMPWSFPHTADAYVRLLKAVDRERFAVHLDPVNMVTSPEVYFNNGHMIRECFQKLGPHIKSCHAKDIIIDETIYTPHLSELRPGLGKLDYGVYLRELSKLKDVPMIIEHVDTDEEYKLAAEYIRSVARMNGISC